MADQGLESYLEQLESQRATLAIQIAGVRAALGLSQEDGSSAGVPPTAPQANGAPARRDTVPGYIRSDAFFRMSVPEAIKAYLEIMKKPQGPKAIADGLKAGGVLSEAKHFYANVFTALKRLRESGQVLNTKTGGWGLAAWYAGRSGAVAEKPKGKKKQPKAPVKAAKRLSRANGGAGQPKRITDYQAFVAEQRKAGKKLEEIGPMWQKKKG